MEVMWNDVSPEAAAYLLSMDPEVEFHAASRPFVHVEDGQNHGYIIFVDGVAQPMAVFADLMAGYAGIIAADLTDSETVELDGRKYLKLSGRIEAYGTIVKRHYFRGETVTANEDQAEEAPPMPPQAPRAGSRVRRRRSQAVPALPQD